MSLCNPGWHEGRNIPADYRIDALENTTENKFEIESTFRTRSTSDHGVFVVCGAHVEWALTEMIERHGQVLVRKLVHD